MALFFFDTSGIVKRYVLETGTAWVQDITNPSRGNILCVARITLPETVAALTRRERGGHIAHAHTVTALKDFQHDFIHQYRVVDISASLIEHAARLARTHALRGYDAVQLAAALEVQTAISESR